MFSNVFFGGKECSGMLFQMKGMFKNAFEEERNV